MSEQDHEAEPGLPPLLGLGAFSIEVKLPVPALGGTLAVRVVSSGKGATPITRSHCTHAAQLLRALAQDLDPEPTDDGPRE